MSEDGRTVAAVVKNASGYFQIYLSFLRYEEDDQAYYWINSGAPCSSLYGTAEEAIDNIPFVAKEFFEKR